MENKDIKQIIDNELSDLLVTDELKQKTLDKIKSPKRNVIYFQKLKYLKNFSLVSSIVVMFVLGINLFNGDNNNPTTITDVQNYSNNLKSNEGKQAPNAAEDSTESTTTEQKTTGENENKEG